MIITNQSNNFPRQIKSYFDYLFTQYGFQVIAADGDYPGFVILESPQCRIKIYQMDGEVNLLFGTRQAPIGWPNRIDRVKQWYYIREILNFIKQEVPTLENIYKEIDAHRSREEQLVWLSQQLKPICTQALQLFELDNFNQQQSALEAFSQKVIESIAPDLHSKL